MLELTGDLADTFIDLMTAWIESSGDSRLVATGQDLFQSLLHLPEATTPETGAAAQWFASMPAAPVGADAAHDGKDGGHGDSDAAGLVEALGLLTAFTRGDLDL
jgi:hypothetical protein